MSRDNESHNGRGKKVYASPEIVCMGDAVELTGGSSEKDSDFPSTGWKNPYPDATPSSE
jgi:hypothetical protein